MINTCKKCNTELTENNWQKSWIALNYRQCNSCRDKRSAEYNPHINPSRMYVNGKYVSKTHPLYKPGNYNSFNDAAFSSFEKYNTTTEGYVYIVSNPAYEGWIKVGKAIDARDRLKSYQTSSPFRNYILEYSKFFNNRNSTEKIAHHNIGKIAEETRGEWFRANKYEAMVIIGEIVDETNT
jgi:hypothetical protein